MWLSESRRAGRVGIEILGDGGEFTRQCCKMATGSGKTTVMAMVVTWHILNQVTYPQFDKTCWVIAPRLAVKSWLAMLEPAGIGNYYEAFNIVPPAQDKLRQGKVLVRSWHALAWGSEEQIKKRRSVDTRDAKSIEAIPKYLRSRDMKDSAGGATVWICALDQLRRSRGILTCYDSSAMPFTPPGKKSSEEALFGWIASDFGLNDAIEQTWSRPRVVVRDDAVPGESKKETALGKRRDGAA